MHLYDKAVYDSDARGSKTPLLKFYQYFDQFRGCVRRHKRASLDSVRLALDKSRPQKNLKNALDKQEDVGCIRAGPWVHNLLMAACLGSLGSWWEIV